jgi:NADPH-dependent 2,4-dienoyl-CoA reductase/sulfur reductase-like enzyme/nitrite reductase/ring-hydroxylating ferredoxin subunit
MGASQSGPSGPDLAQGVPLSDVPETGVLAGHVGDDPVLLLRRADGMFAVDGHCTHYGGPLAEGLVNGDTVRCPWHHACFDLRTGEALAAPAFAALHRWKVETQGERVFVREKLDPGPARKASGGHPDRIVIVGGGAAGFAAAEMLRRRGYAGALVMLSADADPPYDRPNLSKDFLAGTAPDDWMPLKPAGFYDKHGIDLRLDCEVTRIDPAAREVETSKGERIGYDRLLLATGAEPVRLKGPGFDRPNVHLLRSFADSRALIAAAADVRRVAVVGASFIGLEVAASLRHRGLEVDVIAPDAVPLQRVLGEELGRFVQGLHEAKGVRFHLGQSVESFDGASLTLVGGETIAADLVVLGVGVKPRVKLAADAGLKVDDGVVVDRGMRTSDPNILAAGDIASHPGLDGQLVRIEHWVVAERHGQVAALSMLGEDAAFTDAPFFWSQHYDDAIGYVGHAKDWDAVEIDGSLDGRDAAARYVKGGRLLAGATLGRDLENLKMGRALAADAKAPA